MGLTRIFFSLIFLGLVCCNIVHATKEEDFYLNTMEEVVLFELDKPDWVDRMEFLREKSHWFSPKNYLADNVQVEMKLIKRLKEACEIEDEFYVE